jgi:hypothetical protein
MSYDIEIGIARPTLHGVARGIDVAVSVDGHDGEVTLLPAEDGSGYTSWGQPDHWVDGALLAYIYTRPDAKRILMDLAWLAGIEADNGLPWRMSRDAEGER